MVNVSEEFKNNIINEVVPKKWEIQPNSQLTFEDLNYYSEKYDNSYLLYENVYSSYTTVDISDFINPDSIYYGELDNADYIIFSFYLYISKVLGSDCQFFIGIGADKSDGTTSRIYGLPQSTGDYTFPTRYDIVLPKTENGVSITKITGLYFQWYTGGQGVFNISFDRPMLRMQSDNTPKDYTEVFATPETIAELHTTRPTLTIKNDQIVSESLTIHESICSDDKIKLGCCEGTTVEITAFELENAKYIGAENISLGLTFDESEYMKWEKLKITSARKVSSRDKHILRKLVMKDSLDVMDENAYQWFNRYVKLRTIKDGNTDVVFKRQVFSTYYNIAREYGIEPRVKEYPQGAIDFIKSSVANDYKYQYVYEGDTRTIRFAQIKYQFSGDGDIAYRAFYPYSKETIGHSSDDIRGDILIHFYDYADHHYYQYINNGDIFSIPKGVDINGDEALCEAEFIIPYIVFGTNYEVAFATTLYLYAIQNVDYDPNDEGLGLNYNPNKLSCGAKYLPCFDSSLNLIKAKSDVTVRGIVSSLVEIMGGFFKAGRNGRPTIFYPTYHGLYPSNTLFPADDLFPQKSSDMAMPTTYYISAEYEEFQTPAFDGVQVTNTDSEDALKFEYWGNDNKLNAYIIDDNVFLCAEELSSSAIVDEILEEIYNRVKDLYYTPFTANVIGTPFLEAGDRFTLLTSNSGFESFILSRTLTGLQSLKDFYEANGNELTQKLK